MYINGDNNTKMETKRDRFKRIVERRVNTILDNIDSLSKCSNRKNYEYTDDDVKKIFDELNSKLKETKLKFINSKKKKIKFRL